MQSVINVARELASDSMIVSAPLPSHMCSSVMSGYICFVIISYDCQSIQEHSTYMYIILCTYA